MREAAGGALSMLPAFANVFALLAAAVFFFAWVTAMLLDDFSDDNPDGTPMNEATRPTGAARGWRMEEEEEEEGEEEEECGAPETRREIGGRATTTTSGAARREERTESCVRGADGAEPSGP